MEKLIEEIKEISEFRNGSLTIKDRADRAVFFCTKAYLYETFFARLSEIVKRNGATWGLFPEAGELVIIITK